MWITNLISSLFGWIAGLPLPARLRTPLYRFYSHLYKVDLSACSKPLNHYPSLSHFFTRDLKPGSRPLSTGIISPVDGKLRNHGPIQGIGLEQIKGVYYSLDGLLQHQQFTSSLHNGYYFNLYLAPGDYHHVHSPLDGEIISMTYIPGSLFPVNNFSLSSIRDLFVKNERIVIYIRSNNKTLALVMVGATNVGKMKLTFNDLETNRKSWLRIFRLPPFRHVDYPAPIPIKAGERLGTFYLGSTVVLLLPATMAGTVPTAWQELPKEIRYGQQILEI